MIRLHFDLGLQRVDVRYVLRATSTPLLLHVENYCSTSGQFNLNFTLVYISKAKGSSSSGNHQSQKSCQNLNLLCLPKSITKTKLHLKTTYIITYTYKLHKLYGKRTCIIKISWEAHLVDSKKHTHPGS